MLMWRIWQESKISKNISLHLATQAEAVLKSSDAFAASYMQSNLIWDRFEEEHQTVSLACAPREPAHTLQALRDDETGRLSLGKQCRRRHCRGGWSVADAEVQVGNLKTASAV